LPDTREEIVLGQVGFNDRRDELEVLGGPDLALDGQRYLEEPALRVDLSSVREQGGVTSFEPFVGS
jgi:hypothetical protein